MARREGEVEKERSRALRALRASFEVEERTEELSPSPDVTEVWLKDRREGVEEEE